MNFFQNVYGLYFNLLGQNVLVNEEQFDVVEVNVFEELKSGNNSFVKLLPHGKSFSLSSSLSLSLSLSRSLSLSLSLFLFSNWRLTTLHDAHNCK